MGPLSSSSSSSSSSLWIGIVIYFASSLGGVVVVKFLNYHYCFNSYQILALLSRSTWVLALMLQVALEWKEQLSFSQTLKISWKQLKIYFWIAVGLSLVELCNALSMSMLPGNLYMLLKGSDVGFSLALSWLVLGKSYTKIQVLACAVIMVGIGFVFIMDDLLHINQHNPSEDQETEQTTIHLDSSETTNGKTNSTFSFPISMPATTVLCVGGAFLNATCSVTTEAWLKKTLQQEQERLLGENNFSRNSYNQRMPSKLILTNAYSMWTTFFSFVLLLVPIMVGSAMPLNHPNSRDTTSPITILEQAAACIVIGTEDEAEEGSRNAATLVLTLSIFLSLLTLSRFCERLAKYFICLQDSALTFSLTQAARRWFGIYLVGLLFQEKFSVALVVGSILSGIGFVGYQYFSTMGPSTTAPSSVNQIDHVYKKVASDILEADDDVSAGEVGLSTTASEDIAVVGASIEMTRCNVSQATNQHLR